MPAHWSMDDVARCAVGFGRALGLERPHLAGLSLGAAVALAVYRHDPGFARSLALLSGYAGWSGSLPPEEVGARLQAALGVAQRPPRLEDGRTLTGPHPSRELLEELLEVARDARPATCAVAGRALAAADLRDVLPTVDVPTLVVNGEQDVRSPLPIGAALAAGIGGARFVVLPGVGHALNVEAAEALAAVLRPFLVAAEEQAARR